MKKHIIIAILACLCYFTLDAQETVVQTLTYDSTARSMLVEFPDRDHNEYEKILMHYSMRCKDGLVSTGADRNKGCGEWDYSCNTFITDSTLLDSFRATAPSHVIQGYTESFFDYSINPTYYYYQFDLNEVSYNNTISESETDFNAGDLSMQFPLGGGHRAQKTQLLYKRNDLTAAGLTAGIISGLKFNILSGGGAYPRMRVRLTHSDADSLNGYTIHDESFMEVYYDEIVVANNELFIKFYQDFVWDGSSNILVEISYTHANGTEALMLEGGATSYGASFLCDGDENIAFHNEGSASLDIDHDINFEGGEITVAFWYYGSESQPRNSTIFEAKDTADRRQLNVHMPWGDQNIYWDCGNDGSGYDRLNETADEFQEIKKWNHWTFTKNATTGIMRILLNGESWATGFGRRRMISFNQLRVGASVDENTRSFATFDNFQIFDRELKPDEIKSIMSQRLDSDHYLYNNLVVDYDFNQLNQGAILDRSLNGFHATVAGVANDIKTFGRFQRSEAQIMHALPNVIFVRGSYDRQVNQVLVYDSLPNTPFFITENEVVDNNLQIKDEYSYYLAGFTPVYDENNDVVDVREVPSDGTIIIEELTYFLKRPSRFEIMSFVTPYGIGIDFGLQGKTWVFDVTDFGPILKGQKMLSMDFGGQFQEEMDIKFVFVEGTPTRDVKGIQQVWPVTSETYTRIISNERFEERTVKLSNDAEEFALRASITGHGQEGEFIPRTHFLNVNGDSPELEWQVWKECADNAIYPQGGTWIYDRAGWCPGAPTDIQKVALEGVNSGDEIAIDYGVYTASGDSRYIVNVQLVSYGSANFNLDAELVDIINPSSRPEFERHNPMCGVPRVIIKNTGSTPLTSARIMYGVEGRQMRTFNWIGNLNFLEEEEVALHAINIDQSAVGHNFIARIDQTNGSTDEYANNNEKTSQISFIPAHKTDIVVEMRTNDAANETSWRLYDAAGAVLASRTGGLSANTTYRDTVTNMYGCYRLLVEDTDEDGISWWANNDGNGYVQIRDIGGGITSVATDFGKYVEYQFVTEGFVPVAETSEIREQISVYPNPGFDLFHIILPINANPKKLSIYNNQGYQIYNLNKDEFRQAEIEVDLSEYAPGLYFVEMIDEKSAQTVSFFKL
jgi:hypothetical protein